MKIKLIDLAVRDLGAGYSDSGDCRQCKREKSAN